MLRASTRETTTRGPRDIAWRLLPVTEHLVLRTVHLELSGSRGIPPPEGTLRLGKADPGQEGSVVTVQLRVQDCALSPADPKKQKDTLGTRQEDAANLQKGQIKLHARAIDLTEMLEHLAANVGR